MMLNRPKFLSHAVQGGQEQTCNNIEVGLRVYNPVHISLDEVFSKILKKPSIVQKKMIPHMKAFCIVSKMKQKKNFSADSQYFL
jgi:hypothetical protein